jgi:hypothetical protein
MESSTATRQPTNHWTLSDPDQNIHKQNTSAMRNRNRADQCILISTEAHPTYSVGTAVFKAEDWSSSALRHSPNTSYLHSAYKGNFYRYI